MPWSALAGPTFSYLRNRSPHVSGSVHDFYGRLHAGVGRSHGGFPDFGSLDPYRPQAPHQLFRAQGGISCPTALGSYAPGPPGYDRYGQFDSSFVYQQTRGDPFPHLVAVDSRASLVRGSEHNSQSKTYTRLSERDSRPPIWWSLHPEIVERIFRVWGTPEVDMFATLSNSHLPRFISPIPEPRALAVDAPSQDWQGRSMYMYIPPAQQSHAETSVHSGGRGNSRSPLVSVSVVVSTSATPLCGTPSSSPLPSGSSVPAGSEVHLRRKVVPSARMEALMRHYKAAGFSDEVSRLVAAPRRPSTNRMYDDGFASLDGPWDKVLIHWIPQPLR